MSMNESHNVITSTKSSLTFTVVGMTCSSCAGRVEKALDAIPGVENVSINLATDSAQLTLAEPVSWQAIVEAVDKAGYQVEAEEIELSISGMSCASCVGRVEKATQILDGVLEASVNLATERARFRVIKGALTAGDLIETVKQAGYTALPDSGPGAKASTTQGADTAHQRE